MKHGLFAGDLDEVDFIEGVEERFGVAFADIDYSSWQTLGDIHASLVAQLGDIEGTGGQCASQMTFYRLRRAAGPANKKARPDTRLEALGLGTPRKTMNDLKRCGLVSPAASFGTVGNWALLTLMLGGIGLGIAFLTRQGSWAIWSGVAVGAGTAVMKFAPRHYPRGIETLGDLAQVVARRNPMMLKAHGAGLRSGDVWESLRTMASDESGVPVAEIFPDTPFIQKKVKRYAG